MEMVINLIRWFLNFPYEGRQRDEFCDVLEGLYPEYSRDVIDLIVEDIYKCIADGMNTKDIAMFIRATYALENREDKVDEVLKERGECEDKEIWKRERIEKYFRGRRDAAWKLIS